jgi:F-type H+-transporting ATPase subunit b
MLIDWFTVIAQIANFLILVWLMKRYLYHPILNAIDARENRIAAQLKDAETKKSDATKEHDLFQQKNQEFDASRARMIKVAQDSADAERQKQIEAARKDADAVRAKRDATLQNEFVTLERELAAAIQKEAFSIARQTLANLADVNVEAQISKVFITRLGTLEAQSKNALVIAAKAEPQQVQVHSAFALASPDQEAIQQALKLVVGTDLAPKFKVVPDLVCGIELSANGQKLAWSIDDYLSTLDSHINSVLAPTSGQVT